MLRKFKIVFILFSMAWSPRLCWHCKHHLLPRAVNKHSTHVHGPVLRCSQCVCYGATCSCVTVTGLFIRTVFVYFCAFQAHLFATIYIVMWVSGAMCRLFSMLTLQLGSSGNVQQHCMWNVLQTRLGSNGIGSACVTAVQYLPHLALLKSVEGSRGCVVSQLCLNSKLQQTLPPLP